MYLNFDDIYSFVLLCAETDFCDMSSKRSCEANRPDFFPAETHRSL